MSAEQLVPKRKNPAEGISRELLQQLWEEADNNTSTDRTNSGLAKGDIRAELDRLDELDRLKEASASERSVLPGTQVPDVMGRPDYGPDKKEHKDIDQKIG